MPAGSSIYGKGYFDGSADGYSKGYDEGSTAGTLIGALVGAGATGVLALGVWASPKVKAALEARHRKRLEENPPPVPGLNDDDEGDDAE